jgi:uncharacterized repeat protein (TIGR03803 family)
MVLSPYLCARRGAFAPSEKVFRARRALTLFGVSMISALIAVSSRAEAAHVTSKLQVLYAFRGFKGTNPIAGLIADAKGNFYGTAVSGGAHDDGVVFELSPPAPGQTAWTETVLHSFSGADGQSPDTALIADKAGNLYGAAELGGANGVGTVFELSPPREGKKAWAGTVLYSFGRVGGSIPAASLIADEAGNLYGTANNGGARGEGVVFELSPPTGGESAWTETVLHSFHGADGMGPLSGLLADGAGNLYGTAQEGGDYGYGVAYRLSPPAVGRTAWTETVLHTFKRSDGQAPGSSLIADSAGNLYGTTLFGRVRRGVRAEPAGARPQGLDANSASRLQWNPWLPAIRGCAHGWDRQSIWSHL